METAALMLQKAYQSLETDEKSRRKPSRAVAKDTLLSSTARDFVGLRANVDLLREHGGLSVYGLVREEELVHESVFYFEEGTFLTRRVHLRSALERNDDRSPVLRFRKNRSLETLDEHVGGPSARREENEEKQGHANLQLI